MQALNAATDTGQHATANGNEVFQVPTTPKISLIGGVADARTDEAIIGASISIKGTNRGTITDIDGKFTLDVNVGDVLVISYIGYQTKEVTVEDGKLLLITLREDTKMLEEVVVTAYGSGQKKASMVGAVETIQPAALEVPSANLSNAFAGRLAGVVAMQRSGAPGADGSTFYIRGISTISGATNPLIILDGVESRRETWTSLTRKSSKASPS